MEEYLITVELHGASADDYKALHQAIHAVGFDRLLSIDENKRRMGLPIAVYRGWSSTRLGDILAAVKAAANSTVRLNKVYCALVEKSESSFDDF